jgi:hypothetical protein
VERMMRDFGSHESFFAKSKAIISYVTSARPVNVSYGNKSVRYVVADSKNIGINTLVMRRPRQTMSNKHAKDKKLPQA